MQQSLISKLTYMLRSRIRFARYLQATKMQPTQHQPTKNKTSNLFSQTPHPVTLGPEQMSRFFTFVANHERNRYSLR